MERKMLEQFAELVIKSGVVLKKDQELVISSSVETLEFVRVLADKAYESGAKRVTINWRDEYLTRLHYEKAPEDAFNEVPFWVPEFYRYFDDNRACYINISSDDPDLLSGIDSKRIESWLKAQGNALKEHRKYTMGNKVRWCVVSYPTSAWSKKVYPNLSEEEAFIALEKNIISASRIDNDNPIDAWKDHKASMTTRRDYMNDRNYESIIMKNSIGTDVNIKLTDGHIWHGCGDTSEDGVAFFPNIPTEEIFTMPHSHGVDGKVVSSLPLVYNGVIIDKFWLEFKNGEVVDFGAEQNKDVLASIFKLDDGAKRLGEIALVPHKSPISDMNILFYNTLFDENASCHLAFGKAYPSCIKGYDGMSADEHIKAGINDSITHIDFMIGTSDMEILGVLKNGDKEQIFKDGNFVF